MRQQCRRILCVDGKDTLLSFVRKVGLQLGPHRLGALRGRRKEFFVPRIGGDVVYDEVADVDGL
jgi:hypothetical protein